MDVDFGRPRQRYTMYQITTWGEKLSLKGQTQSSTLHRTMI